MLKDTQNKIWCHNVKIRETGVLGNFCQNSWKNWFWFKRWSVCFFNNDNRQHVSTDNSSTCFRGKKYHETKSYRIRCKMNFGWNFLEEIHQPKAPFSTMCINTMLMASSLKLHKGRSRRRRIVNETNNLRQNPQFIRRSF